MNESAANSNPLPIHEWTEGSSLKLFLILKEKFNIIARNCHTSHNNIPSDLKSNIVTSNETILVEGDCKNIDNFGFKKTRESSLSLSFMNIYHKQNN